MPKIKLSTLISDIKGKSNGSVFSRNNGGLYFRNNPSGGGKKSSKWSKAKLKFTSISSKWRNLSPALKNAWNNITSSYNAKNAFGDDRKQSGFELFQSINSHLLSTYGTEITTPKNPQSWPSLNLVSPIAYNGRFLTDIKQFPTIMKKENVQKSFPSYSHDLDGFVISDPSCFSSKFPSASPLASANTVDNQNLILDSFFFLGSLPLNKNLGSVDYSKATYTPKFQNIKLGCIKYMMGEEAQFEIDTSSFPYTLNVEYKDGPQSKQSISETFDHTHNITSFLTFVEVEGTDLYLKVLINSQVVIDEKLDSFYQSILADKFYVLSDGNKTVQNGFISYWGGLKRSPLYFGLLMTSRAYINSYWDCIFSPFGTDKAQENQLNKTSWNLEPTKKPNPFIPRKTALTNFKSETPIFGKLIIKSDHDIDGLNLKLKSTGFASKGRTGTFSKTSDIGIHKIKNHTPSFSKAFQENFGLITGESMSQFAIQLSNEITGQHLKDQRTDAIGFLSYSGPIFSYGSCGSCNDCLTMTISFSNRHSYDFCLHIGNLYSFTHPVFITANNDDDDKDVVAFKAGSGLSDSVN